MSLEVNLKSFLEIKEKVDKNVVAVHAMNQHLGELDRDLEKWDVEWNYIFKENRPKLQRELENLNSRYEKILQDPKRIQFYQKLNNPENEIRRELKTQRERLSTRVNNIQWAKRSIDDKHESLAACRILFEKITRKTDDTAIVEMDSAFMDQDAYHANLKTLERSSFSYLTYLTSEYERIQKNIKNAYPQAMPQWVAQAERLKHKIGVINRYLLILNDANKSAAQKIHDLQKLFKKDQKLLKKDAKNDLNKESKRFIKRFSAELLEAKNKKHSNQALEEFEKTYETCQLNCV